jgi:hypothetical protein
LAGVPEDEEPPPEELLPEELLPEEEVEPPLLPPQAVRIIVSRARSDTSRRGLPNFRIGARSFLFSIKRMHFLEVRSIPEDRKRVPFATFLYEKERRAALS